MSPVHHEVAEIDTDLGPGRMHCDLPADPRCVLLLGHGAGGGVEAPDLEALTTLADRGVAVLRFAQPWRVAGKKVAPAPARLDLGWRPALAYAQQHFLGLRLVVGGRSAGARVAVRCAAGDDAHALGERSPVSGVVALSFPLHPPGRPEKSRASELLGSRSPVLVLQGGRDPFGTPAEVQHVVEQAGRRATIEVVTVPDCPHELKPPARAATDPDEVARLLVERVSTFCDRLPGV